LIFFHLASLSAPRRIVSWETSFLGCRLAKGSTRLLRDEAQGRATLPLRARRTSRQSCPVRGKRVPREKFLRCKVWSRRLSTDRYDVPHLNIFIATRPVLGPDDTACTSLARGRPRTFGSDHLVHPESPDLVTAAQDQFHLYTSCRALDQLVENAVGICVSALHRMSQTIIRGASPILRS